MQSSYILFRGLGHFSRGELREAETACRELLRLQRNHPGATALLARLAHHQSRLGVALRLANMASAGDPNDPDILDTLTAVQQDTLGANQRGHY